MREWLSKLSSHLQMLTLFWIFNVAVFVVLLLFGTRGYWLGSG